MKRLSLTSVLICALVLTVLSGCGGGGGDGGITVQQPTTAVITLATTQNFAMPANTIIAGYDVLISFPEGVTVKSTTPPQADNSVVNVAGTAVGSSFITMYSAATSTLSGTLHIIIPSANANGFSAGAFATVNCDIAAGHYPKPTDFPQPVFVADFFDTISRTTVTNLTNYLTLTASAVIN